MITLDLSLENLYRRYYHCRQNKRNTVNALRFEVDQEKNLLALREALVQRTYRPGRSVWGRFRIRNLKYAKPFVCKFLSQTIHSGVVNAS